VEGEGISFSRIGIGFEILILGMILLCLDFCSATEEDSGGE